MKDIVLKGLIPWCWYPSSPAGAVLLGVVLLLLLHRICAHQHTPVSRRAQRRTDKRRRALRGEEAGEREGAPCSTWALWGWCTARPHTPFMGQHDRNSKKRRRYVEPRQARRHVTGQMRRVYSTTGQTRRGYMTGQKKRRVYATGQNAPRLRDRSKRAVSTWPVKTRCTSYQYSIHKCNEVEGRISKVSQLFLIDFKTLFQGWKVCELRILRSDNAKEFDSAEVRQICIDREM
jgi:hypothetical protein